MNGLDVPVGTVVDLTSASHLGSVEMAARAEDIITAFSRIQGVYDKDVRLVHGFPLIAGGTTDATRVIGAEGDRAVAS